MQFAVDRKTTPADPPRSFLFLLNISCCLLCCDKFLLDRRTRWPRPDARQSYLTNLSLVPATSSTMLRHIDSSFSSHFWCFCVPHISCHQYVTAYATTFVRFFLRFSFFFPPLRLAVVVCAELASRHHIWARFFPSLVSCFSDGRFVFFSVSD